MRNAEGRVCHVDAGGCRQAVFGACHRPWQRKRRLRQVDHGHACRRRAAAGRPARRHHRPRFAAEKLHPLRRKPPRLGDARAGVQARRPRALLRRPRLRHAARRNRSAGIRRLCRGGERGRTDPRFRRHRYAGQRFLPDAARPLDGGYADHPAQRQLRRFRRARQHRSRPPSRSPASAIMPRWCARRAASAAWSMAA